MAELAIRDGMPPPSDLPRGEVTASRLPDGSFHVDHADPRILVSGELLDALAVSDGTEAWPCPARLDLAGCAPPSWRATYIGAVLYIHGVNRTVIYRVVEYVPRVHGYIAEWPD